MPYRDGNGPAGRGAMTGRRLGYCAGYYHRPYRSPVQTKEGEKEYLKNMAQSLEGELKLIQERLNQLAKEQE